MSTKAMLHGCLGMELSRTIGSEIHRLDSSRFSLPIYQFKHVELGLYVTLGGIRMD